jgi:hypothetical protein
LESVALRIQNPPYIPVEVILLGRDFVAVIVFDAMREAVGREEDQNLKCQVLVDFLMKNKRLEVREVPLVALVHASLEALPLHELFLFF